MTSTRGLRSPRTLFALTFCVVLALALCLFVALSASPAAAQSFDRMVVFGDSLSDPGNHFVAFGIASHAPYVPLPDFPYAIGGHHFSNGATWVEQLGNALDMPASGKPALRQPGVFTNYAVGRARARADAPAFPQFDLSTQLGRFLLDFRGQAPSTALYVMWIGANDLDDALNAGLTGTGDPAAIGEAAVTAVAGNGYALCAAGARNFLVPNIPDPVLAPFVRAGVPPAFWPVVTQAAITFNSSIDQALNAVSALCPIQVVRFDVNAVLQRVVSEPGEAGLTNVTDPCLTFGVVAGAICSRPNRHLFWDGAHPTRAGHHLIGEAALRLLQELGE